MAKLFNMAARVSGAQCCRSLCFLVFLLVFFPRPTQSRCVVNEPEAQHKRHFYFDQQSQPITIETSDRASHQLSSHILKILLEDVLQYDTVELKERLEYNPMNASQLLNRLSGCLLGLPGCQPETVVPDTMINLEVWSEAGFNMEPWISGGYVTDAGPLGPAGRFGWFMSNFTVEEKWRNERLILDHWRALLSEEVAPVFHEHPSNYQEHLTSQKELLRHFNCTHLCFDGMFHNKQCYHTSKSCALLLSSSPKMNIGQLLNQVDKLGLYVDIAWLGSNLTNYVHSRNLRNKATLVFDWTPNTLTAAYNFTRVKLPQCKIGPEGREPCDFEINQMSKIMWKKMSDESEVSHLISRMTFTQAQYDDLLRMYVRMSNAQPRPQEMYSEAACRWVLDNEKLWKTWLPQDLSNKTTITIGGMFPIEGRYMRMPGIVPGAQMAEDFINRDPKILANYELKLKVADTQCRPDLVMKEFMRILAEAESVPVAGILGPGCSETAKPLASVAHHYHTVILSYSADVVNIPGNSTFFRTIPSSTQLGAIYLAIFKRFGWKQVAMLAADSQSFPEYHAYLQEQFITNGINVVIHRKMPQQVDVSNYLDDIAKRNVRIIILTSFENTALDIMCEAYKKKMTGKEGYVWFLPDFFTNLWWADPFWASQQLASGRNRNPCNAEQMKSAIQGYWTMKHEFLGPPDSVIVGNMTVRQWDRHYMKRLESLAAYSKYGETADELVSEYAPYAYDAMWVFALSLDKLLKDNPSAVHSLNTEGVAKKFTSFINQTNFAGASGIITFDGAGEERIGTSFDILQFVDNNTVSVGNYTPHRNASGRLSMTNTAVYWPSGRVATDGLQVKKDCSIEKFRAFLNVECDMAIVIANIIGVVSFGIFMLLCLLLVKKRYDDKVRVTRKRMEELGLLTDSNWLSLDQWEVTRDHVVLNRKLGEGAFGTVYGGEAFIEDEWMAVAVKTLKVGSTAEEKLDFLSEAEMMKRFDHENIVKLLGVCTRGEPAYTIMEFMLHGDLKTFLLSRRQLVGQSSKEAEDISPERLTQMALDIAYGLQYLTDMKYVHRDLACRNCLMHAKKSVKIGDFGMTRPLYDSGYYRFNKRGMLPVRWMAPESLTDGLFTAQSDIWSYGVLLFEIVTFGSFPYQGSSNRQVLEYVKNGNVISLPSHCPDELKDVMLSCWNYEPDCRPLISDLVDLLSDTPTLVVPCLDAPSSAVAMEATDSMEMALPRVRHRSAQRTMSEHSQLQTLNSENSRSFVGHSPTRTSIPSDPFSLLTGSEKKRVSQPSLLRSQRTSSADTEPLESNTNCGDVEHLCGNRMDCACIHEVPSSSNSSQKSSSPGSSLQLKLTSIPASLEERVDSDYCSEHSKDIWHVGPIDSNV